MKVTDGNINWLIKYNFKWRCLKFQKEIAEYKLSSSREDPLEMEMATHSSVLAWETHGQRDLVGYSPWGGKESDTT